MTVDLGQYLLPILGGISLTGLAALMTAFVMRRKNLDDTNQNRFASVRELQDFVKSETDPLHAALEEFRSRELRTTRILYGFFQRLFFWEETGRPGPLPRPDADQFEELGIDIQNLMADTRPAQEVRDDVATYRREHSA